jgi:hypothetical protein
MVESAMTHSMGIPLGCFKFSVMSFAAARAMPMVTSSRDSLTPRRLPSMVGLIPIFGTFPRKRFTGAFTLRFDTSAIVSSKK